MPQLYDISRTISPSLAVWPGDRPFAYEHVMRLADGASVNLTRLNLSPHTGSHADAPYHFDEEGAHPAEVSLDKYIGPAHVVTITRQHGRIVPADFEAVDLSNLQRLLIHTWVSDLPDGAWPDDFPYPTLELVDWLVEKGVVLLGLDCPSVDAFDSKDLACHHRLGEHGIAVLETLNLSSVPDGVYELIALPLKLSEVCGSPVRAILRTPV